MAAFIQVTLSLAVSGPKLASNISVYNLVNP